jgi:hypothetical protein
MGTSPQVAPLKKHPGDYGTGRLRGEHEYRRRDRRAVVKKTRYVERIRAGLGIHRIRSPDRESLDAAKRYGRLDWRTFRDSSEDG